MTIQEEIDMLKSIGVIADCVKQNSNSIKEIIEAVNSIGNSIKTLSEHIEASKQSIRQLQDIEKTRYIVQIN